jgi:predicted nicotinamide N-methyase
MIQKTESIYPSGEFLNRYCPFQPVAVCPQILARQAKDIFNLWEAWEKATFASPAGFLPVPHWAVVWPAAAVMAKFLIENPSIVRNKKVLEIGCGGAIASIAALMAGAEEVTANDIDGVTLKIAEENAGANGVTLVLDSSNWIVRSDNPKADVILFADFFYFKSDSEAMEIMLKQWKKTGRTILISDGGRAFAPKIFEKLLHSGIAEVNRDLEGVGNRTVRIFQF